MIVNLLIRLLTFFIVLSPVTALAVEFRFATIEQGQNILKGEEAWFNRLGPAEIAIRLRAPKPDRNSNDVLLMLSENILEWTKAEVKEQQAILGKYEDVLSTWGHLLPETVWFVKTDDLFEGGMPHTRANAIFLPARGGAGNHHVFLHELFHVLSREQSGRRPALYETIGFKSCVLEETKWMRMRKLSNPDVPEETFFLPLGKSKQDAVIPWLHAGHPAWDKNVRGGFGGHFGFGLLRVAVKNGTCRVEQDLHGVPDLISPEEVPEFFEAIGRNTNYIIHPEEVLADNFVFLVIDRQGLPNPEIVEALRQWLEGN